MTFLRPTLIAALAVLAVPATALAQAKSGAKLEGETSQNKDVSATVSGNGEMVSRLTIAFRAPCPTGGGTYNGGSRVTNVPLRSGRRSFSTSGTYRSNLNKTLRATVSETASGTFSSGGNLKGKFIARVKITSRKTGRQVASCSTGNLTYTASKPTAAPPAEPGR